MKTFMANNQTVERQWFVIDAKGQRLGRLSTEVATLIRGKHKPIFTPHVDCGDYVIVINASDIELSGNKWDQKKYYSHSRYPGGLKETSARVLHGKHPERLIEFAVKGMLPKGRLGRQMYKKLYVYDGASHPHEAQKPQVFELKG